MSYNNPHINIFIAYSRKDKAFLDELKSHIKPILANYKEIDKGFYTRYKRGSKYI